MSFDCWLDSELAAVKAADRWRELRVAPPHTVDFASNDYLGLSRDPGVRAAARDALDRWGSGATSSRLISGNLPIHFRLEELLADWTGSEAALVFPSGYQANLGVLTTFGAGARIVSDELNHASIIDGARLARAEVCVYRHGDIQHAASLVVSAPGRAVVVSDTVFSMDGDVADVAGLSELCARTGALLILDDAHAVLDLPAANPAAPCIRVGTLSKALGSQGGYVTGSRRGIDLLVNRARSFIFTTGLAPASAGAAIAAVKICRSGAGDRLKTKLRANIEAISPGHPSPIVPVVLGKEEAALAASAKLLDAGFRIPAIRPPTVPPGTSRLRVSLSAAHSEDDVAQLAKALTGLRCDPVD
jgi:8-amino-7-oxononanoate synthase